VFETDGIHSDPICSVGLYKDASEYACERSVEWRRMTSPAPALCLFAIGLGILLPMLLA
jgi:hypothetical protein